MSNSPPIPRGPLWAMSGLSLLVVLAIAIAAGRFDLLNVCTRCGRVQHGVDYQIPFTRWTWFEDRREEETPLSLVIEDRKLVAPHQHDWQLVTGDGNGVALLFGDGHLLSKSLLSPAVAQFIDGMARWTDPQTTQTWLDRVRDPYETGRCRALADLSLREEFRSREEWLAWLAASEARVASPHP